MTRGSRTLAFAALLATLAMAVPRAGGEDDSPEVRKKKIEAAKKAQVEADRKFAERVNAAIDRGAAFLHKWLKEQQVRGDGSYLFAIDPSSQDLGRLSIILLTLVKCGVEKSDPAIKKGVEDAIAWYEKIGGGPKYTYAVSLFLLMLDAVYNAPQAEPGGKRVTAPAKKKCKYPKEIEDKIRDIVAWIVDHQAELVWRYPGSLGMGPVEDLSNTQYALLALQAAGRCGIDAPATVYKRVLTYVLDNQEQDGPEESRWIENPAYTPGVEDRYGPFIPAGKAKARGWRYLPGNDTAVTGSMTTAGVAALAIVKERLVAAGDLEKEARGKIDRAMVDGLAWLSKSFTVDKNPGQGGWHYYYLYGLERVGAFTGQAHIGKHDWYREGAEHLLAHQEPSGGWPWPTGEAAKASEQNIETCFALLFLRRATVPPAQPLGPVITDK